MRKRLGIALGLTLIIILTPLASVLAVPAANKNILLAHVNIGEDETAAILTGWGPIEPTAHGGNWGGYGVSGELTRVIWYSGDPNGPHGVIQIFFSGSARTLQFDALDGLADDSFQVYIEDEYGGLVLVYTYTDTPPAWDPEEWSTHTVDLTAYMDRGLSLGGGHFVVHFVATGPQWAWFNTYGQVAFDHIIIYGNGRP